MRPAPADARSPVVPGPLRAPTPRCLLSLLALLALAAPGYWGVQQMLAPDNLPALLARFTICF